MKRITHKTHPELWEMNKTLHPVTKLTGLVVDEDKYKKFREEANRIYPHLNEREREIAALHLAHTHPGFHEEPTREAATAARRPVDKTHTRLLTAILVAIAILIILMFATRGHAQEAQGEGAKAAKVDKKKAKVVNAPPANGTLAFIPLSDADAKVILIILHAQDLSIQRKQADQLDIEAQGKEIQKAQEAISQKAQQIAAAGKIDTQAMMLDLDKLGWIPKELSK